MPDLVLDLLKYVFLILLYIFVARAVRAIFLEMRPATAQRAPTASSPARTAAPPRGSRKPPKKAAVIEGDSLRGKTFSLDDELTIGRAEGNKLVLNDSYVSQFHARISPKGQTYVVEDMGSTNGTYLNKRRLTAPAELARGDRVKVGKTVLEMRK